MRILQEGQYERIGEEKTREVDVRIIAATNRDLQAEVAAGRFRSDLYFRLNVFPIELVPLRERSEDIPLLVTHFLESPTRKGGPKDLRISSADMQHLLDYDWPGNIRELQNVLERAIILAKDGRLLIDLPASPGRAVRIDDRAGSGRNAIAVDGRPRPCLLYTSPSPRDS